MFPMAVSLVKNSQAVSLFRSMHTPSTSKSTSISWPCRSNRPSPKKDIDSCSHVAAAMRMVHVGHARGLGGNPNTPYMWLALPAFGLFLPSPLWHMKRQARHRGSRGSDVRGSRMS